MTQNIFDGLVEGDWAEVQWPSRGWVPCHIQGFTADHLEAYVIVQPDREGGPYGSTWAGPERLRSAGAL